MHYDDPPDTKIFGVTLFFVIASQTIVADTLDARVVCVADGDTITVIDADRRQHMIRWGASTLRRKR